MGGMSGSCIWCIIVFVLRDKTGVVLGGGETHVFQNICDKIVLALRGSPQALYIVFEETGVVRNGVGISKGWVDGGYLIL